MSVLKLARTAAVAAALAMLPAHAVAAAPSALPIMAVGVAAQEDATDGDEGNPFFGDYLIPTAIVVVLALALYFALEDEGTELPGPPVSP